MMSLSSPSPRPRAQAPGSIPIVDKPSRHHPPANQRKQSTRIPLRDWADIVARQYGAASFILNPPHVGSVRSNSASSVNLGVSVNPSNIVDFHHDYLLALVVEYFQFYLGLISSMHIFNSGSMIPLELVLMTSPTSTEREQNATSPKPLSPF